jgi:hypothetical protein
MLKILPATMMKAQADKWSFRYASFPPYELVSNPWITSGEVVKLHHLAEAIDKLYNHIDMGKTHALMAAEYASAYDYWMELAELAWQKGMLQTAQKQDAWAYLPICLAQKYGHELADRMEDLVHWYLLMQERRYHFAPPYKDSALNDYDFNKYQVKIFSEWPHLQELSLKELKRRVVIHRLPSLADNPEALGLSAFLYSQSGRPCQGYFSW